MEVSHSFCFNVRVELGSKYSQKKKKRKLLSAGDKLLSCQQRGFLRSEENVILNNSQHLRCIGAGVSCNLTDTMA